MSVIPPIFTLVSIIGTFYASVLAYQRRFYKLLAALVVWFVVVLVFTNWRAVASLLGVGGITYQGPEPPTAGLFFQLISIIGLFVFTVLGVYSQTWYEEATGNRPAASKGSTRVLAVIVSMLIGSAVFGALLDQMYAAKAVWPFLLPLFLAFEKGFLWQAFMKTKLG